MGKIFIMTNHSGGSGGTDTSAVTATADDVLVGKIIVDAEGETIAGSMPDRGAISQSLNAGESYTIPKGYHNGSGKINAKTLASQTDGTATAEQILNGSTAYVDGVKITGTMTNQGSKSQSLNAGGSYTIPAGYHDGTGKVTANALSGQTPGTANAGEILSGKTAWVNGSKVTGTLAVQSVLSFNAAPYSTNQITFTWKNPAKGAFSGVIIVGKTGSAPSSVSDGTRWYKGSGNNTSANGTATQTVSGFTQGTTYYFRAFAYAVKNNAEWVCSSSLTATATTKPQGTKTFTSSGTFTVPSGVTSIDIFCVGGGGGGGASLSNGSGRASATGGGGGYTSTKKGYTVSPGQTFAVTIGGGGCGHYYAGFEMEDNSHQYCSKNGGTTSFGSVLSAKGGEGGEHSIKKRDVTGGNGGSGGAGVYVGPNNAGSNGSDGYCTDTGTAYSVNGTKVGGVGQHTTTRAFGESSGTLYAGGGGAMTNYLNDKAGVGTGGAGGGGSAKEVGSEDHQYGNNGTANTGGGGGGCGSYMSTKYNHGGTGGSGICIVRWGY